jgi:hypothetical protein
VSVMLQSRGGERATYGTVVGSETVVRCSVVEDDKGDKSEDERDDSDHSGKQLSVQSGVRSMIISLHSIVSIKNSHPDGDSRSMPN